MDQNETFPVIDSRRANGKKQ